MFIKLSVQTFQPIIVIVFIIGNIHQFIEYCLITSDSCLKKRYVKRRRENKEKKEILKSKVKPNKYKKIYLCHLFDISLQIKQLMLRSYWDSYNQHKKNQQKNLKYQLKSCLKNNRYNKNLKSNYHRFFSFKYKRLYILYDFLYN